MKLKKNKECGNIYNKIKVEKGVGKEKIINIFQQFKLFIKRYLLIKIEKS